MSNIRSKHNTPWGTHEARADWHYPGKTIGGGAEAWERHDEYMKRRMQEEAQIKQRPDSRRGVIGYPIGETSPGPEQADEMQRKKEIVEQAMEGARDQRLLQQAQAQDTQAEVRMLKDEIRRLAMQVAEMNYVIGDIQGKLRGLESVRSPIGYVTPNTIRSIASQWMTTEDPYSL